MRTAAILRRYRTLQDPRGERKASGRGSVGRGTGLSVESCVALWEWVKEREAEKAKKGAKPALRGTRVGYRAAAAALNLGRWAVKHELQRWRQ